jgi:hypothetical protein
MQASAKGGMAAQYRADPRIAAPAPNRAPGVAAARLGP